ncbi:MAG: 23S rRNA (guanosine(2251)-2'-O)-methyltransferase RlmB [Candidatus Arsenophonus melophagi]|nr:23S rRNA (guanosine(2251)-2'-O)-methyltransferase RlmB [Candidatus Arsenophonus melophagi]
MNEIIYGIHAVQALLKRDPSRLKNIYILQGHSNERLLLITKQLKKLGIIIQLTSRYWMDRYSKNAVHQGIIAQVKPNRQYQENDLNIIISQTISPFLLILDRITDPHNLGACLRSAEAAGIDAVIIPKKKSAQLNATAKKVACGAAENIPLIRVTNLARTLHQLKRHDIWIIGAAGEAQHTLYDSKLTGAIALVMGAEDKGMRRLTMEHCDELMRIPIAGMVSFLNVSVAAGVCLFEAVRQRRLYS